MRRIPGIRPPARAGLAGANGIRARCSARRRSHACSSAGEDLGPGNDAASDDAGPDGALGRVDPSRFRGAEGRVGIGEDEVLHVDVADQVALDGEGLFVLFIVRECQVRLVVENADGRVGEFRGPGQRYPLRSGSWCRSGFPRKGERPPVRPRARGFPVPPRACPVAAWSVSPGAKNRRRRGPGQPEQVGGLYCAAEFVDGCRAIHIVQ